MLGRAVMIEKSLQRARRRKREYSNTCAEIFALIVGCQSLQKVSNEMRSRENAAEYGYFRLESRNYMK